MVEKILLNHPLRMNLKLLMILSPIVMFSFSRKKHEISDRYKVKVRTIKKRVEEFLVIKK
jgi:hypothetical protein